MGYPKEWLKRCEGAKVPDVVGEDCRLLFVGINPGLSTALIGVHFGHPSNRFWPALQRAGLIDRQPDLQPDAPAVPIDVAAAYEHEGDRRPGPRSANRTHLAHPGNRFYPALAGANLISGSADRSAEFPPDDRSHLIERGIGITNLVDRATARADELTRDELHSGAERLESLVAERRPAVVAVAGITAFRTAFRRPRARVGEQGEELAGAGLWAVPNPSGLNAHETIETLAEWYRRVGRTAGLI